MSFQNIDSLQNEKFSYGIITSPLEDNRVYFIKLLLQYGEKETPDMERKYEMFSSHYRTTYKNFHDQ